MIDRIEPRDDIERADVPLVKGGQGREDDDVYSDGKALAVLLLSSVVLGVGLTVGFFVGRMF